MKCVCGNDMVDITCYGDENKTYICVLGCGYTYVDFSGDGWNSAYAGTASIFPNISRLITEQMKFYKQACSYCGNKFVPDKRGRCASCGGAE